MIFLGFSAEQLFCGIPNVLSALICSLCGVYCRRIRFLRDREHRYKDKRSGGVARALVCRKALRVFRIQQRFWTGTGVCLHELSQILRTLRQFHRRIAGNAAFERHVVGKTDLFQRGKAGFEIGVSIAW